MFRHNNGQFKMTPPATVVFEGYKRNFTDLTREQWDELGYNEAMPIKRAPFTAYETQWVKGDDLIYREEIVTATVDEETMAEHLATTARTERDHLLSASDWTQLNDSILDAEGMVVWQSYRQALRDVPQQPGFPKIVDWPELPAVE